MVLIDAFPFFLQITASPRGRNVTASRIVPMALTKRTAPTETAIRRLNSSAVGDVGRMTCFAMVGGRLGSCFTEIAFPSVSHYRGSISGTMDCDDGFDESNCTRLHYHGDCLKTQYECDNGRYDMGETVIVCSLDFCLNSGTFPMFQ